MNPAEYGIMYAVEERHWWYLGLHDLVMQFLAAEFQRQGPLEILDAGCGTGRLCQLMGQFGRVSGCDVAPEALEYCRFRQLDGLFQADLNHVEFREDHFQVITCMDVLYHAAIVDDQAVLARLYRSLQPGGLLLLNLPASEALRGEHDLAIHTARRYGRRDLRAMLERAGFRVELMTCRLALPYLPILAVRLASRLCRPRAKAARSDLTLPADWLNGCLLRYLLRENRWIRRHPLPFGSSVFAAARRP